MNKFKGYMAFNYGSPMFNTLTRSKPYCLNKFFDGDKAMIGAYYEGYECGDQRMTIEKVVVKRVKFFNEETPK